MDKTSNRKADLAQHTAMTITEQIVNRDMLAISARAQKHKPATQSKVTHADDLVILCVESHVDDGRRVAHERVVRVLLHVWVPDSDMPVRASL